MIVVITEAVRPERSIRLDDGDNFTELAVDAVGLSRDEVTVVVSSAGAGAVEGEHLWIGIDFLRNHGRGTGEWNHAFAAMIDYAGRNGWIDDDGGRVRAHIRWK
ncbi:MAG: hypothetical protein EOP32_04735 [Rhodococcus sp. (in: high G+C Gram-positive bacteria)]|nr:MAG: hypothetical protein EOP32_04735 [Rhodococcus sp. (in: high G+C Gram-positive bacteria)]